MNKKCFKRLILLHELGVYLDDSYIKSYNSLDKLMGYPKDYDILYSSKKIMYSKGDLTIFEYNILSRDIFLYNPIYEEYLKHDEFKDYNKHKDFMFAFFENRFKHEVLNITSIDNYDR